MPSRLFAGAGAVLLTAALCAGASHAAASATPRTVFPSGHSVRAKVVNLRSAPHLASHVIAGPSLTRSHPSAAPHAGNRSTSAAPDGGTVASPFVRTTNAKFDGLVESTPGCGCTDLPEPQVAISASQIVEVAAGGLAAYSRSGVRQFVSNLNTLLGTGDTLYDAHLLFDPTWNRFVILVAGLPADNSSDPTLYSAVSASADPTGTWYVYGLPIYWAGSGGLAVHPALGMDRDSLLVSSDQYLFDGTNYTYSNSYAYAIPKNIAYNNLGSDWNSALFQVNYETVPATVMGSPTPDAQRVYLVSPDSNLDTMHVYSLVNSSHFGHQKFNVLASAPYSWDVPQRPADQPGTTTTLSVGDGRITGMVAQLGGRIWFAHGVTDGSFPSVQFGYVTSGPHPAVQIGTAYHSVSSDDFDPSLTAMNDGAGYPHVFLNWAYTDTSHNLPLRDTWDTQAGAVLKHKVGLDYSPAGSSSSTSDMSVITGAAPDYHPACGTGAVLANQYFAPSGTWRTRIAEVGTC